MQFRVKLNTTDKRTIFGESDKHRFGPNNEGFVVEAETKRACMDKLQKPINAGGFNLNPFYLQVAHELPEDAKMLLQLVIDHKKTPAGFRAHARDLLAGHDPAGGLVSLESQLAMMAELIRNAG